MTRTRKIDNLGRIILPESFLTNRKGKKVTVFYFDGYIYICDKKDDIKDVDIEEGKTLYESLRKVDNMNRVCIPIEIRKMLMIEYKSELNIIKCDNYLKILKVK